MMGSGWWAALHRCCGTEGTQRQWLLLSCLLGSAASCLLFHFFRLPGYDPQFNLLTAAVFIVLAMAVPLRRFYTLLSNLGMLAAVTLMVYITAQTGGINSPAMVWFTIMAVPAMLLLGRRWALFWLVVISLIYTLEFVAVQRGWIDGAVALTNKSLLGSFTSKLLVMLGLMLAVSFYENMHSRQMREVQQRNADLESTQQALQMAQSHKDEFIASVGHELRTPMNAILGLNGVLLSELVEQPENVQIASHIRDSTRQLLGLVNDILDFSLLEAGQLSLLEKPLHVEQTLRRVLAGYTARAAEKSLRLECVITPGLPEWVLLDPVRLEQILGKLLDNALKFTNTGSVRLGAKPLPGRIGFEVEDSGRGIAPEHQQQVFKRFEHADLHTKRTYGGTGLGLAICERLVSLQGGRIGVRSSPGVGSLFWFDLPLQPTTAPVRTLVQSAPIEPALPLRILVVDDNAVNLRVARLVLEKCWPAARIASVSGGESALTLLDTQPFDLVLMDLVMPEVDGLETTRRLRAHARPEVARVPVVGLTASTLGQERERCLQSGMDEVLNKPLEARAVIEVVLRLAGRSGSGREAGMVQEGGA